MTIIPNPGSALSYLVVVLLQGSNEGSAGEGPITRGAGGSLNPANGSLPITPAITPELLLGAISLATIVGILAGLYQAWRASKLAPVEALRSL